MQTLIKMVVNNDIEASEITRADIDSEFSSFSSLYINQIATSSMNHMHHMNEIQGEGIEELVFEEEELLLEMTHKWLDP